MHFDVGAWIRAADRGRAAGGTAAVLLHTGKRMIARQRRGVAGTGFRTCCAGTLPAPCTRGARRLHAGKRVIALKPHCRDRFSHLTRRRVASRGAAGTTDVMALRRDRGNRRTRMRGNDAGAAQLRRVGGRRDGRDGHDCC